MPCPPDTPRGAWASRPITRGGVGQPPDSVGQPPDFRPLKQVLTDPSGLPVKASSCRLLGVRLALLKNQKPNIAFLQLLLLKLSFFEQNLKNRFRERLPGRA